MKGSGHRPSCPSVRRGWCCSRSLDVSLRSVCGGWELTAQHLGFAKGKLAPIDLDKEEVHNLMRPYHQCLVRDEPVTTEGDIAGKINMGIGGINACVICRKWRPDDIQ